LIPAIQDFAAAKKMDLASAFEIVTKSIVGQTNMLGRYGIQVEGSAKTTERFNSVLNKLNATFGGTAKAAGEAGMGPVIQFKNAIGDLGEDIGTLLLPNLTKASNFLNEMIEGFKVTAGLSLGNPIKDLTLMNDKITEMEDQLFKDSQKKGFFEMSPKYLHDSQQQIDKLKNERATLQAKVNEILNPKSQNKGEVFTNADDSAESKTKTPEYDSSKRIAQYSYGQGRFADAMEKDRQHRLKLADDLQKDQLKTDEENAKAHDELMQSFAQMEFGNELARLDRIQKINDDAHKKKIISEEEYQKNSAALNQQYSDYRMKLAYDEAQKYGAYAGQTIQALQMVAQANKADAHTMKGIAYGRAVIDSAGAGIAAARTIWSQQGGSIYQKIAETIGVEAMLSVELGAQLAMIKKQSFGTGTSRAPGGLSLVGEQGPELAYLPSGTAVSSALETRSILNNITNTQNSGGNVAVTFNVTDATTGDKLLKMLRAGDLDPFISKLNQRSMRN
jgi:hypothetical protein